MDDHLPPPISQPATADTQGMPPPAHERPFMRYAPPPPTGPQLDVTAIIYALFKHKWKIVTCSMLGFLMAVAVYFVIKPAYQSEAKLVIKYIREDKIPMGRDQDAEIRKLDLQAATIITTEMEIMQSKDLAESVVAKVGPERILNNPAAAGEHHKAAEMLQKNLVVDVPNKIAQVIRISYTHTDPAVAQAVVRNLVAAYLAKHVEIHRRSGETDKVLVEEIDTSRATLLQMEEELRKLKARAGTDNVTEQRRLFATQIAKLQEDIMATDASLAETRAVLESRAGRSADVPETSAKAADTATVTVPPAKASEYQRATTMLSTLVQREREYLLQYTEESLVVTGVRQKIAENQAILNRLEEDYPSLKGTVVATPLASGGIAVPTFDRAGEEAKVAQLLARKKVLQTQLAETRAATTALSELEPLITELERQVQIEKDKYVNFRTSLDQQDTERKLTGMNSNILDIQNPSAPARVPGVRLKFMAVFLVGGVFGGLALALGLELFIDQSVRRTKEIEGSLGLPLFFSIPYLKNVAKLGRGSSQAALPGTKKEAAAGPAPATGGSSSLAPAWSPAHGMRSYFDALRDRLVFYFEIRNFTRKPKLIAVAGCSETGGVSTIASGLAASLSESGDGNVLLVDMNPGNQTPFHFHKGELKPGLDDALENEKRDGAMVRDNLYVVSHASGQEKLAAILPKRFTKLVPKLKASDYDYIIFDLPPINHISATPQLARYMDMTLMVVESEKTSRETTKRVGTMFTEAGVNFGVVLNKTRDYLPRPLRNMLSSES